MIVALVALFAALGTGAYAQVELAKNSVGTDQIKPNAVRAADIAPGAVVSSRIRDGQVRTQDLRAAGVTREKLAATERVIWAVVRADGTEVRESGEITGITRASAGRYNVSFVRPVNDCAWVASTSSDSTTVQGYAEVQRNGTATSELIVLTSRPEGGVSVFRDLDFQLVVACGKSAKDDEAR
jgi:hypothetical protein